MTAAHPTICYIFPCSSGSARNPPPFPTRRPSDLAHPRMLSQHGERRVEIAKDLVVGLSTRPFEDIFGNPRMISSNGQIGRAHVELQSHHDLVCRLLLEKKNRNNRKIIYIIRTITS